MADQGSEGLLSPLLQRARLNAARPWLRGHILDVGCGTGALAEAYPEADYLGFDRDAQALEIAIENRPNHRFTDRFPSGEEFDTIVALAVIEHLPNPEAELRKWSSCLTPKGRVVLTTPHRAFHSIHDIGARVGIFSSSAAEEHQELFDKRSLHSLAARCGLTPVKYERFLCGANQLFIAERPQDVSRHRDL